MSNKSKYFKLNKISKKLDKLIFKNFIGWSGLHLSKINIPQKQVLNEQIFDKIFPKLKKREKIFFSDEGKALLTINNTKNKFKKFDILNLFENVKYSFKAEKNTNIFMIANRQKKKSLMKKKFVISNFKKDIKPVNLWGGKIISRPYEGHNMTLVYFQLKNGFSFHDNGHSNEQITWLNKGKMFFYVNKAKKTLTKDVGVSIGSKIKHGGFSKGANGFDAFHPKRKEKKYLNK